MLPAAAEDATAFGTSIAATVESANSTVPPNIHIY
jgi:hypothetical protein